MQSTCGRYCRQILPHVLIGGAGGDVVPTLNLSCEMYAEHAEHALQAFPADPLVAGLLPALDLLLLEVEPRGKVLLSHVGGYARANKNLWEIVQRVHRQLRAR